MQESFCIAAFRSRMQVMAYEKALRMNGIPAEIVTTPRAISMGCGLSVRFRRDDLTRARLTLGSSTGNLIGFYQVTRGADGRLAVAAI